MNDSLIYPCLIQLMKIIDSKQDKSQIKEYYHAHLLIKHFLQANLLFSQKSQLYKNLLNYYQKRWILQENDQSLETQSCFFLKEIQKLSEKDKMVCQIIAKILVLGIQASMSIQIKKAQTKPITKLCEQLHMNVIFEGGSISNILLEFIQKITTEIKNLIFYQTLLKIFVKLDFYQIINFLERTINKFRQDWNKNQQQMQVNVNKKSSRESVFLPSVRKNLSLEEKEKGNQKGKENDESKPNIKSMHKTQKQAIKSNFKIIKTAPKMPQSSRRRTLYKNTGYTFNNRSSTSNFFSSMESTFEETRVQEAHYYMLNSQRSNQMMYHCSQNQMKIMQNEADDILADNTPKKKKRANKI